MTNEKQIDNLLSELKKELLTRESYHMEAVTHSRELEGMPEVGTHLDGCLVIYMDNSNRKRLADDIVDRDIRDKVEKITALRKYDIFEVLADDTEDPGDLVQLSSVMDILQDKVVTNDEA